MKDEIRSILDDITSKLVLLSELVNSEPKHCYWTGHIRYDGEPYWDTSCQFMFSFFIDGPKENNFKFCPYCGKPIISIMKRPMKLIYQLHKTKAEVDAGDNTFIGRSIEVTEYPSVQLNKLFPTPDGMMRVYFYKIYVPEDGNGINILVKGYRV